MESLKLRFVPYLAVAFSFLLTTSKRHQRAHRKRCTFLSRIAPGPSNQIDWCKKKSVTASFLSYRTLVPTQKQPQQQQQQQDSTSKNRTIAYAFFAISRSNHTYYVLAAIGFLLPVVLHHHLLLHYLRVDEAALPRPR